MSSGLTGSCFGSPAKYTTRARLAAISSAACCACFDGAATLMRLGAQPAGAAQQVLDAVVLARHPGVVDERRPTTPSASVEPLAVDVGQEHPARAAVAGHDRLPAADRAGAEDQHACRRAERRASSMPFSAQANGSATVARSDGQVVRERDQVLHRDRRHRRLLRVGAGERVVAVQQVVLAEVLEAVEAPAALAAREDRAEEHPVALASRRAAAPRPGPTCSSTPTGSWPSTHGAGALGSPLKNVRASVPQMPHASTRRIAPAGSSSGSSASRTSTAFDAGHERGPHASAPASSSLQRLERLVGRPPLADHARRAPA